MKPITYGTSTNSDLSSDAATTTVYDCALLELPRIADRAGNITVLERGVNCPFDVVRVFYIYDVPGGAGRAGHAHRRSHQLLVAASGSFDVLIDDGYSRRSVSLNRPYYGLHVVPGVWNELSNFSSGSICLVLSSSPYDAEDYVRDYREFCGWKHEDREALSRTTIHR